MTKLKIAAVPGSLIVLLVTSTRECTIRLVSKFLRHVIPPLGGILAAKIPPKGGTTCRDSLIAFHRQNCCHDFNSIPEVLQPQILVGAVLVIVVVDNRYANRRCLKEVRENV